MLFQLTVGQKVDSEQLPETEETAENFDDCSLNKVQEGTKNRDNNAPSFNTRKCSRIISVIRYIGCILSGSCNNYRQRYF